MDQDRLLVMLNFSQDLVVFNLPQEIHFVNHEILIRNYEVGAIEDIRSLALRAYEARVFRLG